MALANLVIPEVDFPNVPMRPTVPAYEGTPTRS
jgi:hypothetical protein